MKKQLVTLALTSLFSVASYSMNNANQIKDFFNSSYVICSSKAQGFQKIDFDKSTSTEGKTWQVNFLGSSTPTELHYTYTNHPTKKKDTKMRDIVYKLTLVNLQKRIKYGTSNVQNSWDAYASSVNGFSTPGLVCRFEEDAQYTQ